MSSYDMILKLCVAKWNHYSTIPAPMLAIRILLIPNYKMTNTPQRPSSQNCNLKKKILTEF